MKRAAGLISAFVLVLIFGACATSSDLNRVHRSLDQKINSTRDDTSKLQKEVEEFRKSSKALQKGQADTGADLIEIRDGIKALRGAVEELRKDVATLKNDRKVIDAKLNDILFRLNFLENFIGIGKKGEFSEAPDKNGERASAPPAKEGSKEAVYSSAYRHFKEGKYEDARRGFQRYVEQFPKTEHADNAQFWIGECYYAEGKFEKSIIEYEKVIKNYPSSDKLPPAMLKQAFSFLKLGDKSSAKLLLQQVMKDYPNTNQARMAKTRLQEIR